MAQVTNVIRARAVIGIWHVHGPWQVNRRGLAHKKAAQYQGIHDIQKANLLPLVGY